LVVELREAESSLQPAIIQPVSSIYEDLKLHGKCITLNLELVRRLLSLSSLSFVMEFRELSDEEWVEGVVA
jgi:hypothetical protein